MRPTVCIIIALEARPWIVFLTTRFDEELLLKRQPASSVVLDALDEGFGIAG